MKSKLNLLLFIGLAYDFFGYSIALSEDSTVIGAFKVDDERGSDVGAAYVHTRAETGW